MSEAWFDRQRSSIISKKIRDHKAYDAADFELCLKHSVAESVRLQAEAGIDVVSDGEYGKSVTWAFYFHKRLSGIEWRAFTDEERRDPMAMVISGRDRDAFPEFYGEYDQRLLSNARAVQRPVVTGPISYTGQAELQRDIATLKAAMVAVPGTVGFLPVVAPASAIPNALGFNRCKRSKACHLRISHENNVIARNPALSLLSYEARVSEGYG